MFATLLLTAAFAIAGPPNTQTPDASAGECDGSAEPVRERERSLRIEPTIGVGALSQIGVHRTYGPLGEGLAPGGMLGASLVWENWRGHRGLALRGQFDASAVFIGDDLLRGQVGLVSLSRPGRAERVATGIGALAGVHRRTRRDRGLFPSSGRTIVEWMPVATVHGEVAVDFDSGATRIRPVLIGQVSTSGAVMVGASLGVGTAHRPPPSPAW